MIRVLVAGLGNMGRSHALAYHNDPAFEIVGLVNRSVVDLPEELKRYPLSEDFTAALAADDRAGAPKDGSAYYETWLSALERFLVERDLADTTGLAELRQAWTDAYLSTPHGQPVELGRS